MASPGMSADLTVTEQLAVLIAKVRDVLPECRTVTGLESLDEAMAQAALLPAAVVVWAGDQPEKMGPGMAWHSGQRLTRSWIVFLVLELMRGPEPGLELAEKLGTALTGWHVCRGSRPLVHAGSRFVARFDRSRVIYSVSFGELTAIKP